MKLLLRAVFRTRRNMSLIILSFLTLILLTLSSQLEMFSLGVLTNRGADFFALFGQGPGSEVSYQEVQERWKEVADPQTNQVSSESASAFLVQHGKTKTTNPLLWLLSFAKEKRWFSTDLIAMIGLLLGVSTFKALWLFASRYSTKLLAIRVSRDLREQYFAHIQTLPMTFYQQYNIGSLSSRVVGDAGQIALSINSCVTNYLQTPFTVLTSLAVCFYISWQLSLVIFVGAPLLVFPIRLLTRRVRRVSRQLQSNQEKFASVLQDFLAGIQTVKIFAMESFSFRKYQEENDKMACLEGKSAKYGLLARPILHAVTTLCLAAVVLFGLYILGMSISQLLVFCGILHLVYEPVKQFAEENATVQKGVVAAERMFEVLSLQSDICDEQEAISLEAFQDQIVFDHVWFRYPGRETYALKDVSFTIQKGQTVAIVGPTGSGKSTLAQLLPRLYDIEQGEIRIDGKPLSAYTQRSLREQIAFVAQKPFLFLDTIEQNITVGRELPFTTIEVASRKAHAEEFIAGLPNQYQTMLIDMGQNLSGGQQQRLAIARALACNAPILIMDEATSSLDAISEHHIKSATTELHGEVTQIIIAHRLSTIEHADRIIYLDKGEKIAEGTKEELLVSCPPFRAMWEMMFASTLKS